MSAGFLSLLVGAPLVAELLGFSFSEGVATVRNVSVDNLSGWSLGDVDDSVSSAELLDDLSFHSSVGEVDDLWLTISDHDEGVTMSCDGLRAGFCRWGSFSVYVCHD